MSENNNGITNDNSRGSTVAPVQSTPKKGWVRFEEESKDDRNGEAAVINTQSVQVNLERSISSISENSVADSNPLKNVQLPIVTETVRQGFCKFA